MIKYLIRQNSFYLVFKIIVLSLLTSLILLTNFYLFGIIDQELIKPLLTGDNYSRINFIVLDTIGQLDQQYYDELDALYQTLRNSDDYIFEYTQSFDGQNILMDVNYYQKEFDPVFQASHLPCYLVPKDYKNTRYNDLPICGNTSKIDKERVPVIVSEGNFFIQLIDTVYHDYPNDASSLFFNSSTIDIAVPKNYSQQQIDDIKAQIKQLIVDFYAQLDTVPTIYINDIGNQQRSYQYRTESFFEEYFNRNIALLLLTFVTLFILNYYFFTNNLRYLSINRLVGNSKWKAFNYFGCMNIITAILSGILIYLICNKIISDGSFYALWIIVACLVIGMSLVDNSITLMCLSSFNTSKVNQILRSKESE